MILYHVFCPAFNSNYFEQHLNIVNELVWLKKTCWHPTANPDVITGWTSPLDDVICEWPLVIIIRLAPIWHHRCLSLLDLSRVWIFIFYILILTETILSHGNPPSATIIPLSPCTPTLKNVFITLWPILCCHHTILLHIPHPGKMFYHIMITLCSHHAIDPPSTMLKNIFIIVTLTVHPPYQPPPLPYSSNYIFVTV